MVVKTITVTEEAYEALKRLKMENESFSQGILRVSQEKKINPVVKYFGVLKDSKKEMVELRRKIKERRAEIDKEAEERAHKIRERLYGRS